MDRVETKVPDVGFSPGVGDEAAVPARTPDATGAVETPTARRRSSWVGTSLRIVRNAAIAVAVMAMVPIGMVAYNGDIVWRLDYGVNTTAKTAVAERARSFALPKDPAITPMQAGQAFDALTLPSKDEGRAFPRRPGGRAAAFSWEALPITPEMFVRERWGGNGGLSSDVFAAVARGISPKERDYLRAVATAPEWRVLDIVARAPAVDFVGGHFIIPFPRSSRWPEFPIIGTRSARELAQASIARAAWFMSTKQVDSAEATLRGTVSLGFAFIDNANTLMDQLTGAVVVGTGRDALQRFYVATGNPLAEDPGLAPVDRPDLLARTKWPTSESRREVIARVNDPNAARGARMESLRTLSLASCGSVKELLFGPNDDVTSAIARAKQSLGRYPSEKALAELATDMPRTTARETTFDGLAMVASSAASVAGAVLRNERMATCTLVVGPWRR